MQLHDTWIDLQDQKHSLGEELLEWITDWLGDRKPVSARGMGIDGRLRVSRDNHLVFPCMSLRVVCRIFGAFKLCHGN